MKLKLYQRFLILSALLFVVLLIWKIEPGCLVQRFFNIPCPTCGMTRAFFAMFNGDLKSSLKYHPMIWSVPVLVCMFIFYEKFFTVRFKRASQILLILIILLFIVNYLCKILGGNQCFAETVVVNMIILQSYA